MPVKTQQEITASIERLQALWNEYLQNPTLDLRKDLIEKSNSIYGSLIYLNALVSLSTSHSTMIVTEVQSNTTSSVANKEHKEAFGSLKIDVRDHIGVNEKFRFINELFSGNSSEYNIALNQINSISSLDELTRYLANLKNIYQWPDSKQDVIDSFQSAAYRLFP